MLVMERGERTNNLPAHAWMSLGEHPMALSGAGNAGNATLADAVSAQQRAAFFSQGMFSHYFFKFCLFLVLSLCFVLGLVLFFCLKHFF